MIAINYWGRNIKWEENISINQSINKLRKEKLKKSTTTAEHIFFSDTHGPFTKNRHIEAKKRDWKVERNWLISLSQNISQPDGNQKQNNSKIAMIWKIKVTIINKSRIKEEIIMEI